MSVYEKLYQGRKKLTTMTPEEWQAEIEHVREKDRKAMNNAVLWGLLSFALVYIPLSVLIALLK